MPPDYFPLPADTCRSEILLRLIHIQQDLQSTLQEHNWVQYANWTGDESEDQNGFAPEERLVFASGDENNG